MNRERPRIAWESIAQSAAERARAGDWDPLINFLEARDMREFPVTDELRDVLAKILKGELRRPNNRPAKAATEQRKLFMCISVMRLEDSGAKTDSAVAKTAQRFNVSPRQVYRALEGYAQVFSILDRGMAADFAELREGGVSMNSAVAQVADTYETTEHRVRLAVKKKKLVRSAR